MARLGRILIVALCYGLLGAVYGAVAGAAAGALLGLVYGDVLRGLIDGAWYSALLGAVMLASAAVMSDDGNSLDVFRLRRRAMSKPAVLFLCTNNAARSQMAEALLRTKAAEAFDVYSAGTDPKPAIDPLTVRVMREVGIDVSGQHPKGLLEYLGRLPVRVAISVCPRAEDKCPTLWPGALARLEWPFEDPAACAGSDEERLEKFRAVRDQIDRKITDWLTQLTAGR